MMHMQFGTFQLGSDDPSETTTGDTSTFYRVSFPTPFPNGEVPVVLVQTQTFNGEQTPGLRIAEVDASGFLVRMNEIVVQGDGALSDGSHNDETIGYIAFAKDCTATRRPVPPDAAGTRR